MALTLQQKLEEAEAAYHSLQTGRMPRVVVDQNGERVEFTAANASKLYAYISDLRTQISVASNVLPKNGPIQFTF